MKKLIPLMLLFSLVLTGCQGLLLTSMMLVKGRDEPPKHDILLKGEKRVAVVPRALSSNAFELQNAPQQIARQVRELLDTKVTNKKLQVVEQEKVEKWLDNCNNNFDTFGEVGKDKSINADIVIGFTIVGFQIRDPQNPYLLQGKCQVQVEAVEVSSGRILSSDTLMIAYPPNVPMHASSPGIEPQLRREFLTVIARHIGALFHPHIPHEIQPIDADTINLHRL